MLPDGRIELFTLAQMYRARRTESTPPEQARNFLADVVAAIPERNARESAESPGSADSNDGNGTGDFPEGTLGRLLYGGRSTNVISEGDWVGLIQSIAAGDGAALRAIFERTHRIVFTLVMRLTQDQIAAEELTLKTFLDVWQRAPEYDASGTVLEWIMKLARFRGIDYLSFGRDEERVDSKVQPSPGSAAVRSIKDGDPLQRRLKDALALLTAEERQAIESAYFSAKDYAKVASELKRSPQTIKQDINSGFGKLRRALADGVEK